ncbi:MAG: sodium-dependent transporter [Bacteroidaceae bacterium]|nr:sodium-dependent transporter [Bacteroidaceae bacterium]
MNDRGSFGSKFGVILASAGSAVGLGNVWRFPTEVGNNGGAAFIIIYLLCVVFVGVPVMVSEFVIGRHTHANTISAYSQLAPGTWWRLQGVSGVFVAFLILSYYIIISGWTLFYLTESAINSLSVSRDYSAYFNDFVTNPWEPVVYAAIVMLIVHVIIARGVQSGIEKFSKIFMPLLLVIIIVLVGCSFNMPGSSEGLRFLLQPDFSKVTPSVVLSAMGQAFFSLSLAMGCLCTYASYFGPDTKLVKTAVSVSVIDTCVAVLSGFIIFPAVFSVQGVEVNAGPGLVFITLPNVFIMAFHNVPALGYIFSGLFYMLLLLAAVTSAMSLHESVTAYVHEVVHVSRRTASAIVSISCMLLGVTCSLSFGLWSDFTIFGMTIFDLFDFVASKILMPIGGLVICLFVGWYLDKKLVHDEITNQGTVPFRFFQSFIFLVRYVVPVAMTLIFVNELLFR